MIFCRNRNERAFGTQTMHVIFKWFFGPKPTTEWKKKIANSALVVIVIVVVVVADVTYK